MRGRERIWGGLALLAAALATGATADAQAPGLAAVYGGGSLPVKAPTSEKSFAKSLAVTLVPDGASMRVRVSIVLPCSGGGRKSSGDDLLLRVALAPDGSFSGVKRVRSDELGSARVKVAGAAAPGGATGTVEVASYKRPQRCRSGVRSFVAKPVDANAPLPAGGPPIAGGLYVGLSSVRSSIPLAVVVRMSSDGATVNHLFGSDIVRCKASGARARKSSFHYDLQGSETRVKLRNGSHKSTTRKHETRSVRRRGIRATFVARLTMRVTDGGLLATFSRTETRRERGHRNVCRIAKHRWRLVPAG